jgi:DNA repair exonuclease SbcCD ATPase subunit
MWDQEVALRVRERKMAEIGNVVKYTNADRKAKLLGELGRDICICNCEISGCGVCVIPSAPVDDPGYRSALSGQDLEDEEALDSVRISPPRLEALLKEAFAKASETAAEDRTAPYKEALETVKAELAAARDSVEDLSARLDYSMSRAEASEEECKELKEAVSRLESEIRVLKAGSDRARSAKTASENVESLSSDIDAIRRMKSSMIDRFIDEALSNASDADLCDEIVMMLKRDIRILDVLSAPDGSPSVKEGMTAIPKDEMSQDLREAYESRLDGKELAMERRFRRLMSSRSALRSLLDYVRGPGLLHLVPEGLQPLG